MTVYTHAISRPGKSRETESRFKVARVHEEGGREGGGVTDNMGGASFCGPSGSFWSRKVVKAA